MNEEILVEEKEEDKVYKIDINGNTLTARLNGNVYKVEGDVSDDIVAQGDTFNAIGIDDNILKDQKCVNKWKEGNITNLVFDELSTAEKREITLKAQIEFLSMMNDIEW